jgi:hypothetical protein
MRLSRSGFFLATFSVTTLMCFHVRLEQTEGRGGFSGGSFRGGGGYVKRPSGGGVAVGPGGGVAVRGPQGGVVATLPDGAVVVVRGGRNYYLADDIYYQPCYVGDDVNYCVVSDLDQDGNDENDDGDDHNNSLKSCIFIGIVFRDKRPEYFV